MVNLQKESPLPGLNTQLPFEFFHHFIGRVLTNRGDVIDSKFKREAEAAAQVDDTAALSFVATSLLFLPSPIRRPLFPGLPLNAYELRRSCILF